MEISDLKEKQNAVEVKIEKVLTEFEAGINEDIKRRAAFARTSLRESIASYAFENWPNPSEYISDILEEFEKDAGIKVVGIDIERLSAGTLEDPDRSIIGDIKLQVSI